MDNRDAGLLVIALGVVALVVGAVILAGGLSWFGRLPGDFRFGSENTRIYVPITTVLLLSVVLSLVSYAVRRFL